MNIIGVGTFPPHPGGSALSFFDILDACAKRGLRAVAGDFLSRARSLLSGEGVPPDEAESEAWRAYVRSLFRLNEFVYLD